MLGPLLAAAVGITIDVDISAGGFATHHAIPPAGAFASLTFGRDGSILFTPSGGGYDWHTDAHSTVGDDYEIMAELVSGTAPTGASLNTWHSLSSDVSFTKSQGGEGVNTAELTVYIRRVGLLPQVGAFMVSASVG